MRQSKTRDKYANDKSARDQRRRLALQRWFQRCPSFVHGYRWLDGIAVVPRGQKYLEPRCDPPCFVTDPSPDVKLIGHKVTPTFDGLAERDLYSAPRRKNGESSPGRDRFN